MTVLGRGSLIGEMAMLGVITERSAELVVTEFAEAFCILKAAPPPLTRASPALEHTGACTRSRARTPTHARAGAHPHRVTGPAHFRRIPHEGALAAPLSPQCAVAGSGIASA